MTMIDRSEHWFTSEENRTGHRGGHEKVVRVYIADSFLMPKQLK